MQQPFRRAQGADETAPVGLGQMRQEARDLLAGAFVQGRVGRSPGRRQDEVGLAGVALRPRPLEKSVFLEPLEDSAQIAGIQFQIASELLRGRAVAIGEFVQDAGLREENRCRGGLPAGRRGGSCRIG